jgi:alpha-N-acetylglucosamine transferase
MGSTNPENPAPKKVWTTLITNTKYLSGLLTLDYSLKKSGSKYPLVALCTDGVPPKGIAALEARKIPWRTIPYLLPSMPKEYTNDPRFYDCWSKLTPFNLTEYDRVVQMDSDMLVLKNMDELMELHLDSPDMKGEGHRVYAASHACACNPLKKPHYPNNWTPENCAFTSQHEHPDEAQHTGPPPTAGIGSPNGGLVVVNPSKDVYEKILRTLKDGNLTDAYDFADQSLLGDRFYGRWVGLPYTYNALKTMRWEGVHHQIWRDGEVKNVHYILSPKPWDENPSETKDEAHTWWQKINEERIGDERAHGVDDGF